MEHTCVDNPNEPCFLCGEAEGCVPPEPEKPLTIQEEAARLNAKFNAIFGDDLENRTNTPVKVVKDSPGETSKTI